MNVEETIYSPVKRKTVKRDWLYYDTTKQKNIKSKDRKSIPHSKGGR